MTALCFKADNERFERLKTLFPDDYDDRFRQFTERTIDIYAVVCDGEPVGRIVANYTDRHLTGETAPDVRVCLSHFILRKAYRGRGLGSRLLRFALDDLAAHGYREFTVGVEPENSIALHIYRRNGFTEKIGHGHTPCEYDLYLKRI